MKGSSTTKKGIKRYETSEVDNNRENLSFRKINYSKNLNE